MTISEAQSDEESDCHRRYSYNSERGGSAWALNDTETILVSVFTYIDNWCGRRNPSPARSLHHHKAPQCQATSENDDWLQLPVGGQSVRLCYAALSVIVLVLWSSIGVLYPTWKEKLWNWTYFRSKYLLILSFKAVSFHSLKQIQLLGKWDIYQSVQAALLYKTEVGYKKSRL